MLIAPVRHRVLVDSRGSYVRAPAGKLVAVLGMTDVVVVPRSRAQDVRAVVDALKGRRDDLVDHVWRLPRARRKARP